MVACPTCGGELEYIAQYDRYYCYTCKKYAPKESGKAAEPAAAAPIPCPTCGRNLTFIPEYDRYYCYSCNKYAPKGIEKQPAEEKPTGEKLCPTCGKPLSYVEAYGRWYCYSCKKYAPKEEEEKPPEAVPIVTTAISEEKPAVEMPPVEVPVEVSPPAAAKVEEIPVEPTKEEAPTTTTPVPEAATPAPAPATPAAEPVPAERPPLEKRAIETGKKSYLVSLCQAYGLDSSGNRAVLKQRLLEYMTTQGVIPKEEEEEEGVPAEVAPTVTERPPEIIVPPEKPAEVPAAMEKPQEVQAAAEKPPEAAIPVITLPVTEKPPEAAAAPEKPPEIPKPAVMPAEAPPPGKIIEKPPEEVPAPPPKLIVVKAISPCPTCGRELTFIKTYNRYYCYNCRKYAPEEAKVAPAKPAAPKPAAPARIAAKPVVRAMPEAKNCPTCGGALSYIRQYNKWYCYNCRKYIAEKPSNLCPTCGSPLEYLAQYDRYYCYNCKKYAPERAVQAVPVAMGAQVVRVERAAVAPPSHTHGSIWAGVTLAVVALVMFILLQLFIYVPTMLGIVVFVIPNQIQIAFLLQLFFGVFLCLAVIVGLVGARKIQKKP